MKSYCLRVQKENFYICLIFFLALVYGLMLASLPNELFRDRENYVIYALDSAGILNSYDSFLLKFFNEPFFLFLNIFFKYFFNENLVPSIFVFFIAFTFAFISMSKARNALTAFFAILLILFVSQILHSQLVTLRQGVATAILMWLVHYCYGRKKFVFFVFLLGFIHSAFFVVAFMFFLDKFLSQFTNNISIRLCLQFIFGLAIAFVGLYLASMLGLRQANESHLTSMGGVGGGNFIVWSLVLLVFLSFSTKKILSDNFYIVAMLGIAFYLALYFFSPMAGRLISVFLPFCIVSLTMNFSARVFFVMLLVLLTNCFIFFDSIKANSLSEIGVQYLSSLALFN